MAIYSDTISFSTKGNTDVIDITPRLDELLRKSGLREGFAVIHAIGSTGAVTTCEFEPGLVRDFHAIFDQLIPPGDYAHHQTWGDHNGHSHLRASLVGPSVTVTFQNKKMRLGTWQQVVFIDFDTHSRRREVAVQFVGEK